MAGLADPASWTGVRKTAESPPRVAVYDVIQKVKGCSASSARVTVKRLKDEGLVPECDYTLVTPGSQTSTTSGGNRSRGVPVANARQIVQLIWMLPGAKDFRWSCADVCVRYLGGDATLVEEIFLNRAAQERLSEEQPDHPARMFGEDVEAASRKRRRSEELEELQYQLRVERAYADLKRVRRETCNGTIETYRELGAVQPLDSRQKQWLSDFVHSHMTFTDEKPGRRELCVRAFLLSKGVKPAAGEEIAFGKQVARRKREDLRAKGLPVEIPKKTAYVNGQQTELNLYFEEDRPLFEAAWSSYSGGKGGESADIRTALGARATTPHHA